jgi:xylan 1,4-beta-xylosidase
VRSDRSELVVATPQQDALLHRQKPVKGRFRQVLRIVIGVVLLPILVAVAVLAFLTLRPSNHGPESELVGPPAVLTAAAGLGQITVRWNDVQGAVRYQVYRGDDPGGKFTLASTFQPNLPARAHRVPDYLFPDEPFEGLPHSPFVDTSIEPGRTYYYRVISNDGSRWSRPSALTSAAAPTSGAGNIQLRVDTARETGVLEHKWEVCLNSEHLSYLFKGDASRRLRAAGTGLRKANQRLHGDFGIRYIRAHGILMDDLGVYREDAAGRPVYDWAGIDRLYDTLLADGMKPVAEFTFMPSALAVNPNEMGMVTSFYRGVISQPKDYNKWGALVGGLTRHLMERYGREEVESWYFEVWNEPDFRTPWIYGFWTGSDQDYFRLYDFAAEAVKSIDPKLRVGGPVAATTRLIEPFLKHVSSENFATGGKSVPIDFLDFHMYFAPPFNWRPVLARYGFGNLPLFLSEWGVDTWWGREANDLPYGAAWIARGLFEGSENADMIAYWCSSDYYEENGPPGRFFHGGFGLLGIDGVRKAQYWAFHLLHQLGTRHIALEGNGDGFGGLVQGWATRADDGAVRILLSNVTFDQTKARGSDILSRQVSLNVTGLAPNRQFRLRHYRIDNKHSNVYGAWLDMGRPDWPDTAQLAELHRRDALQMLGHESTPGADSSGNISLEFGLPMPSLSLVELVPLIGSGLTEN